jgi:hypothetical protein
MAGWMQQIAAALSHGFCWIGSAHCDSHATRPDIISTCCSPSTPGPSPCLYTWSFQQSSPGLAWADRFYTVCTLLVLTCLLPYSSVAWS